MLAFFSPIATNYDVCVLKWRRTVSPCKFFDRIGRKYKEIDVSQVRATVLDLNDQTGLQLVDNFEREKSPLALVRLQQFLEARGYQIDRISQQNVCIEYYRYYPIGPLEKVDQKQG